MTRKNNKIENKASESNETGLKTKKKGVSYLISENNFLFTYRNFILPLLMLGVLWFFLKSNLSNRYTNWDDNDYVTDNLMIKDTTWQGVKNIFDLNAGVQGNYHPLTMLSLALDYRMSGMDPYRYHLSNLLFHMFTCLMVFVFILRLSGSSLAAFLAALLFGLHPMHMESVSWVSGRKDVVYGLFYVAACYLYLVYAVQTGFKKGLMYIVVILVYLLSLLSKPSAVLLPLSLIVIDIYIKRRINIWMVLEKLPLFALSVLFGLKSIALQNTYGAVRFKEFNYTFIEQIAISSKALFLYLKKLIVPEGLRCFYAYPASVEYTSLIAVLVLGAAYLWFGRKNRILTFAVLFFLFNIGMFLQFIPVGAAIIAERYTYIPYLGFFALAGVLVATQFEKKNNKALASLSLVICLIWIAVLGNLSDKRSRVWYDSISLWNDEIEKQPDFYGAYNNLGYWYYQMFDSSTNISQKRVYFDSSYMLTSKAIEINKDLPVPYITLGELERYAGNFNKAKTLYFKGMSIEKDNKEYAKAKANIGLGIIYGIGNNMDSAGYYLRKALKMVPMNPDIHNNIGNFYAMAGKHDSSFYHYGRAIQLNKKMYTAYLNRGRVEVTLKLFKEAIKDFDTAASMRPDQGEIFYARAGAFNGLGDKPTARKDLETARRLGFTQIDSAFYRSLQE